ncbi:MAG: dihydroorotase [Bacteroidota bacterium]
MNTLVQQVKLYEPTHPLHLQQCDILIEDGIIQRIAQNISDDSANVLPAEGCWASIGFMDIGVQVGEPGLEHRETLESVCAAAAAGGYTAIASFPNTEPVVQSKSELRFLNRYSESQLVDILPIGAITKNTAGKDLTEMYDLSANGAIAFSDGDHTIQHSGVLLRALQYAKGFNGIIIHHPDDAHISGEGQMHEGSVSTQLGLKGIPSLAEELMLLRDIELLDYTNGQLHVHLISTAESVHIIRRAKERGLNIAASTSPLHLNYNHESLSDFDTQFKVKPPLRAASDQQALLKGIQEGVIDCISSAHTPLEQEAKFLEFPYAEFGALGLQTALSLCLQVLTPEETIDILGYKNRKAFGLDIPTIKEGKMANLTVFHPEATWKVRESTLMSVSKNSPLLNHMIKGEVWFTFNKGYFYESEG